MENVSTKQNDLIDCIKIRENLIQYGRYLESRALKDNDINYDNYLKLRVENSKLEIGCFLLHLKEAKEDLAIIDLENDECILFGEFEFDYDDSANGGIHIKNEDVELNIEVNSETAVRNNENQFTSIIVDNKWSLEVW